MIRGTVTLEGMHFYAYHGCLESERVKGNDFYVDLSFVYDMQVAAKDDSLRDAVDYSVVYNLVKQQMQEPCNLLEHLAWKIKTAVQERFPEVLECCVKVSKACPPVGGEVKISSVEI